MVPQKRQTSDGASITTSDALQLTQWSGANLGLGSNVVDVLIKLVILVKLTVTP